MKLQTQCMHLFPFLSQSIAFIPSPTRPGESAWHKRLSLGAQVGRQKERRKEEERERRGSIRAAIRTHPNTASGCSPLCMRRKTDTGLGTFPCCLFPLLSPISIGRSQKGCLLGCSWQRENTAIVFHTRGFIVCELLQASLWEWRFI